MNTPWLFSSSHFFLNIFHIHPEAEMRIMQNLASEQFQEYQSGLRLHYRDHKAKQASPKASCKLLTGGDLDTLYTHWCSFQILLLCIRKGNGDYVFSIFHFSVFPRDISCHYFMWLQIFLWLALVTQCCQLAADHLLFLHILVYVGIWYIVRKVWPVSRISHVSPYPALPLRLYTHKPLSR